ncbi:MAG: c-type cytochrome [Verrucomicrobiaceae bacterium]|nr:c-type cytochrome [Verrucomicrobiaceae bacterium]
MRPYLLSVASVLCVLLSAITHAQSVKPDDIAGNEAVKKIMETRPGRGVMRDDTPPTVPQEAVKKFQTRPDVAIDLMASEPEVRQPLYASWDSKGRMWVNQYIQYQFPAGLKIVSYDQHLRAKFDKVPEPPPNGAKGADVITVFEDTDGDGFFDKHTDVIKGLNIASSVITGAGSIWVMNPPYLLRYPDANDDGMPDGDPEVALRGFGLEDTHSVASSLQWGPDGWLYGANGSTTTGNVSSTATKNVKWEGQCIWRYNPKSKIFEIYAEGGGNTFSLDIDSKGRVFSGTNAGNRGMHYEQGSYGIKGWGKHGPLTNPYAFGWFEHLAHEGDNRRFSQAYTIYEGGLLGSAYDGKIISPNSLLNLVYVSERIPVGSTFRTKDETNLVTTPDRWFRPVWAGVGPDGGFYMADWYDTRLSHVSPVDDWDKSNGRIYRVRPASGVPKLKPFDLHKATGEELIGYLSHANEWFRKQAANEIAWRDMKDLLPKLIAMAKSNDEPHALDALWAADMLGGVDDELAASLLSHKDIYVRRWAVRIIGDKGKTWEKSTAAVAALAKSETNHEIRAQLAASAKRLAAKTAMTILRGLLDYYDQEKDDHLPLLVWWAMENKAEKGRDDVLAFFADRDVWSRKITRSTLATNLAKRYALAGGETNLQSCAKLVSLAPDDETRGLVVAGIASAFEGAEMPKLPDALAAALNDYLKKQSGGDLALALRTGDEKALKDALKILGDSKAPSAKRIAIAKVLSELGKKEAVAPIIAILSKESGNEGLKRAVLQSAAKFDDKRIAEALLTGWEGRIAGDPALRETALRVLAGRKEWAQITMAFVDEWKVPAKHFSIDVVRQLSLHNDPRINASIEKHWKGLLMVAPTAEMIKEAGRIKELLKAGGGDASKGKVQFTARCSVCHKLFGEGRDIAPELTPYDRGNMDFWLNAILTPSLEIREGFGAYIVKLKNGQLLTGLMAAQDAKGITIKDPAGNLTPVRQADIEKLDASPVSLMPPMLLTGMSDADLRDFFAYLMKP